LCLGEFDYARIKSGEIARWKRVWKKIANRRWKNVAYGHGKNVA